MAQGCCYCSSHRTRTPRKLGERSEPGASGEDRQERGTLYSLRPGWWQPLAGGQPWGEAGHAQAARVGQGGSEGARGTLTRGSHPAASRAQPRVFTVEKILFRGTGLRCSG